MTARQSARVLAVDDRRDNLLALQAILEGLPIEIVSVTSGEDALKRLLVEDYAVIGGQSGGRQLIRLGAWKIPARVPKRRNTVPLPRSARSASPSMVSLSAPCSASISRAVASRCSRLRTASARSTRGAPKGKTGRSTGLTLPAGILIGVKSVYALRAAATPPTRHPGPSRAHHTDLEKH